MVPSGDQVNSAASTPSRVCIPLVLTVTRRLVDEETALPLVTERLSDRLATRIALQIDGGGLHPGDRLPTEQQLAAGADIIFGMGDGASFGMIEAIREHNEANADSPAWFIDVIGDKAADYSDVLLTSVLFDYTGVYEQIIGNVGTPDFGQIYTMNVENGGVRLLDLPASVSQETKDAVATAQASIIDGTITVSAVGDAAGVKTKLSELGYS